MANHTGVFATVEPIKGDTSEWVHKNNKPFFDQIEKENQKDEKAKSDLKKFKGTEFKIPEPFKVKSLQEIVNAALPTLMEKNYKFQKERDEAIDRGDLIGTLTADNKIKKLNNVGDIFKSTLTAIEKEGLDFQKGIEQGRYFPTDQNIQRLASFSLGNFETMVDDETGDIMFAFQDINNDGVIDEKDKQHFTDFVHYKDLYNNPFGEKAVVFDQDKKAREIGTKLGEEVKQKFTASGGKISETKVKEELLENFSLNKSELAYLRASSDVKMSDEEFQQAFRDKIKSYADDKDEVYSGGARSLGSSRKGGVNQGKEILYIDRTKKNGIFKGIGPVNNVTKEVDFHGFTISGGGHNLTAKGINGVVELIKFFPGNKDNEDKIEMHGYLVRKETLGSSDIYKVGNNPLTTVKTETEKVVWDGKHEVLSVLADYLGVKNYKQLVEKLKELVKENEDDYGVKK